MVEVEEPEEENEVEENDDDAVTGIGGGGRLGDLPKGFLVNTLANSLEGDDNDEDANDEVDDDVEEVVDNLEPFGVEATAAPGTIIVDGDEEEATRMRFDEEFGADGAWAAPSLLTRVDVELRRILLEASS